MIDDRDLGRFAVRGPAGAAGSCRPAAPIARRAWAALGPPPPRWQAPDMRDRLLEQWGAPPRPLQACRSLPPEPPPRRRRRPLAPHSLPLAQNLLALAIAVLFIAYNYVTADPRKAAA